LAVLVAGLVWAPAGAGMVRAQAAGVPGVWAVALPAAKQTRLSRPFFVGLRRAGVSTLVVQRSGWGPGAHKRLVRYAANNRVRLVEPVAEPKTRLQRLLLGSRCAGRRARVDPCAVLVRTPSSARVWLKKQRVDFVVLRLASPAGFSAQAWPASKRSRLLVVVPLSSEQQSAWQAALTAPGSGYVSLAGQPAQVPSASFDSYLAALSGDPGESKTVAAVPDTSAPSAPGNPTLIGNSVSSLTVAWSASSDDVAVAGYEIFLDGVSQTKTASTVVTISDLDCETTFTVGIEAYDAAGNHSARAAVDAMTQYGCFHPGGGGGGGGGSGPEPPAAPNALTLTGATTSTLSLAWAPSSGAAGYHVFLNGALTASVTGPAYSYSGLTCATSYTLAVAAFDATGLSSTQTTSNFQTAACPAGADTTPPSPPGPLTLGALTTTSIALSWAPASDDTAVTGYALYKNGVQTGTTTNTTATLTSLTCGTSYTLGVEALDAANNHSTRTSRTATTNPCTDSQAPSAPSNLHQTSATTTSITITWNPSTDNTAVTGYTLYKNTTQTTTQTTTTYTYTGLTCGTTYTLAVDAYDAANNHSTKTTTTKTTNACPDTQAPTTPSGLTATGASQTSIGLTWTAATDNIAVTGYTLYRNGAQVATQGSTTYTHTGLTCGTTYTLAVDAYDAAGNHSSKTTITKTTNACSPSGATLFMSPSGSDSNPCTQPQPCRSFNRAYHAASSGATVEVAGGSYGGETITGDASKVSTADVVFRPASGASVLVTDTLNVQAAHIEWRDMEIKEFNFPKQANDITVRNVINHGVWMQGPSDISIIGGEVTCGVCGYHSHIEDGGAPDFLPPRNILFDGVYFHDWGSISGEHVECLQILGGDNVTIRNSIFRNCGTANGGLGSTADLHIAWLGNGAMTKNILIENNFFYAPGNVYAIQMDDYANIDLRYNSIVGPILIFDRSGPGTGIDIVGNILRASTCTAEGSGVPINWRYNVMQGGACGASDKNAAPGFDDASNNLHLTAGSAAVNAGDPTNYPAADIDGDARPSANVPDAGADEVG
jgi:chitodextrinase